MIRLLASPPPSYALTRVREQAVRRWSWRSFIDVRELGEQLVLEFENANPPTQADVDAFIAGYDASPLPPSADQGAFDAAVAQLRATFNQPRTAPQINNSLDALTVILRRAYRELQ